AQREETSLKISCRSIGMQRRQDTETQRFYRLRHLLIFAPLRLCVFALRPFAYFAVITFSAVNLWAAETNVMQINQAVMVTLELDFGKQVPTIAEALTQVERKYKPDDGSGRTFAILDAYGEPTPEGKLHMSMHVSTEKPGLASLVFRRTGE